MTIKPFHIIIEILIYAVIICFVEFILHQVKIALALNIIAIVDVFFTYRKYIKQNQVEKGQIP